MALPLYRRHDAASQAKYQELGQLARSQRRVLAGTPGTLKQRTQSGNKYWVREHIRVDGKKTDDYIGPASSTDRAAVDRLAKEIELAKALAAGSAQLRLLGYQRIDRKPAAVLEVFFNRKLFQAGLTLVGSHAYGALLNEMGLRAPTHRTPELGPALAQRLEVALPGNATLESLLSEEGSRLVAEELVENARAIPLLDFLVRDPVEAIVLSPNQVIPVRAPSPERFALHKLFSSQSRTSHRDKARKDLAQAALLAAVLEEDSPGRLAETFRSFPARGKPAAKRGALAASRLLDAHPEAQQALRKLAGPLTRGQRTK